MAAKLPEKALKLIRDFPRVTLGNVKALPGSYTIKARQRRSRQKGGQSGRGNKGSGQKMTLPPIGFEGGNTPFYLRIPKEPYYRGHHLRREYPPITLLELQRLIDLGRVNPDLPIDITSICNTKLYTIKPMDKEYGFNLKDEGADIFVAKVNIEVQWASEATIAAIERNGGTITTRFFSQACLQALVDPLGFFKKGIPIPKCPLPPEDAFEYYTDPKNRGYLADPEQVAQARVELAQKYGYILPNLNEDLKCEMLKARKDPRQIFFGLSPGWVVSLKDKVIIKPKDEEYQEYYTS